VNPNQAPFNLTLNNPLVTGGASGYTVSYHETQAQADDLTSATLPTPYIGTDGQIVIVRVINNATGCYTTTTLQLNVTQGPVANTPTPLTYCDPNNDGFGEFNLADALNDISGGPTPTGVNITFHETPEDAQLGTNPITDVPYNNIVEDQQTIYVAVSYDLTGCANYTELTLIVNPTPEIVAPANPLAECDDDTDGFTQFDLTQVEPEVLNGIDPTTVTITYYLSQADAEVPQNAIVSIASFTNTSNPQTIYIRVEYNATGCYSIESFDLVVNPLPIMPVPEDIVMSLCDVNNSGDQVECFDLNSQIPLIVNGQTNMIVTFHPTQADAINNTAALSSPYCNQSNAESIFVRLENGDTGCFDTVIMDLRVEPLPVLVLPPPVEECGANQDGFAQFDLTALEVDMLNGATDITLSYYETFTDADQQTNPIPDPAAYQNLDPYNQIIYVRADNIITGCFTIGQIQLIVHESPIMPELDDLVLCDDNYDGHVYFDLSVQNPIILAANTISPLVINYYTTALDAMNGTGAIVDIANYYNLTNPQTIWVVVKDPATGCSETTTFDLIVNIPVDVTGQNNKLTLCDEGLPNDQFTTFDLTVMNAQILGSSATTGATLVYYPSVADAQAGTNAIADPTAYINQIAAVQTLGVVVTSAEGCNSITTLTIRVEPLPTPKTDPPALIACDDDQSMIGTELFDLTTNITYIEDGYPNLMFEYYPTEADAIAGTNEITTPTAYEGSGIIIIKVMNNRVDFFGANCYQLVEQELIVNPLPVVTDTTYVLCDDDSDGMATFVLSDYNEQLLGTTQLPADYTVTYYDTAANAQAGTTTGLLPDTYNGTNLEMIYPRVVNNTTGCANVSAVVTLSVKLRAIANPISQAILDTFTKCDYYNDNDGVEQFDLTAVESDILGTQTVPPISITYHLTAADQATGDNPIANTTAFENTSNPQIIYIRVARANDDPLDTTPACYDVAEITLNVELLGEPVITSPSNTICVDFNTGDLISGLTLDSGIPQGSGYTYQWALNGADIIDGTGEGATYDITSAAPGDYTVVVTSTSPQGCVSDPSAPFTVIQSGPAANVEYFVSGAFEETQTISVLNEGNGIYHYQLDDGPIVDNGGIFTNVPAGEHTVTIYDVKTNNPCDAVTITGVSVINYPHFFTPNGDGINDTWNITGLSTQTTAKIYIFDRYGKLLKQISAAGEGWNGTLNGQPLPSTDYWFTVDFYEKQQTGVIAPRQFKAHFTLKR
jgi:large repetitive protein